MALAPTEAEALAVAVAGVAEHYDIAGAMAPETMAWIALVQTAGMIYGPRIFAARIRKKMAAEQQSQGYTQ